MPTCQTIKKNERWELLECEYEYIIRSTMNHRNRLYIVKWDASNQVKQLLDIINSLTSHSHLIGT